MKMFPNAFLPLKKYNQFMLLDIKNKVPLNPRTFWRANPFNPTNWGTLDEVLRLTKEGVYGVTFALTKSDPFFFIDIDNCYTATNGWSDLSKALCTQFKSCGVEVSRSNKGLHLIGMGSVPPHSCKKSKLGLEFYTEDRCVAITGKNAVGRIAQCKPEILNKFVDTYFPPNLNAGSENQEWTSEPVPEWTGSSDDETLIKKMLASKSASNVFGTSASCKDLWEVNTNVLDDVFPPLTDNYSFDHSSADAALCQHLAFWTGKNCERMDEIFRMSGLYRDKWEERETYSRETILKAVGNCTAVYDVKKKERRTNSPGIFMSVEEQKEHFKNCVYVRDIHRVYVSDGAFLKPEQFRATYGGYAFVMGGLNSRTTRSAWEAFTESEFRFPKVQSSCFRPTLIPGKIIIEEGYEIVNTYVKLDIKTKKGDPSPFLNHLKAVLPVKRDQQILLTYIAACVQFPGVKFQWTPLLQGVEGNGKTFFMNCLARTIGRRYSHFPNASDIGDNGSKFNGWIENKLFIGIEEIFVGDRREISDALKTLLTNERIEIQKKGVDQYTGDNVANFFLTSNHKGAVIKTLNDRRYCVLFSAQQELSDLIKCGWILKNGNPTNYFPNLYNWLNQDGYEIVADFLLNHNINEEFNPAGSCHRAPFTSSTNEAVTTSLGRIEQEVLEAIAEERPGFKKGWISSMAFDRLLEQNKDNKRIPPNKRRPLLQSLGYDLHPALPNGRVNNIIPLEGGKPRLYIRNKHTSSKLSKASDISKQFEKDQEYGA